MGWTSYHATNYKNGKVDRKAEMDKLFTWSNDHIAMKVLKSSMVSTIYYAAVEEVRDGERTVFAAVCITGGVDRYDPYFNFSYKDMDETCGPFCYDCPESILKLLSPTTSEFAQKWRDGCRKHRKLRKALNDLPVGSVIEFERVDGTKRYVKHAPAFQFKKPFWYNPEGHSYIPSKNIPDGYCVIKEGK